MVAVLAGFIYFYTNVLRTPRQTRTGASHRHCM